MRRAFRRTFFCCLASGLATAGCIGDEAQVLHPAELAGTWVARRADGAWVDTLAYRPDGRVLGTAGHPVGASASWSVVRSRRVGESLCTRDGATHSCLPYRLEGDTLLVIGYLQGETYLRRASARATHDGGR